MLNINELKSLAMRRKKLYKEGLIGVQPYSTTEELPHTAGIHLTNEAFAELSEGREIRQRPFMESQTEAYFVEDGVLFFTIERI